VKSSTGRISEIFAAIIFCKPAPDEGGTVSSLTEEERGKLNCETWLSFFHNFLKLTYRNMINIRHLLSRKDLLSSHDSIHGNNSISWGHTGYSSHTMKCTYSNLWNK